MQTVDFLPTVLVYLSIKLDIETIVVSGTGISRFRCHEKGATGTGNQDPVPVPGPMQITFTLGQTKWLFFP